MIKFNRAAIAIAFLAVSAPAAAVNAIHAKAFDKFLAGAYTDRSPYGAIHIERVGDTAYYVQGGNIIKLKINDVTIVSPLQIKAIVTNQLGGVYTMDRVGNELDIYTPNGQVMNSTRIRDNISDEKNAIRTLAGKSAPAKPAVEGDAKAGFDCSKAGTRVEVVICNSPDVAALDLDMTQRYVSLMKITDDKAFFRQDQRKWIAERNLCQDSQCLRAAYQDRLQQLDTVINHLNKPAEFR